MRAFAQKQTQSQSKTASGIARRDTTSVLIPPIHPGSHLQHTNGNQVVPELLSTEAEEAPAIVHEVLHSPGEPLDSRARDWMERGFGHDFSRVKVHSDSLGAQSASAVNALAYTVGTDIVFGAGQYSPQTPKGLGLLAHELTHVVQQSAGGPHPILQRQVQNAPNNEDWNFTPADLTALHQRRGVLRFGPDSAWIPARIRITLLSALDQMLSTVQHVGIPATMGVSVRDLFHCHVVVPARSRTAATTPDRLRLEQALRAEERQTQQQFQNSDITDTNRAQFRRRLEAEQQTATPLLESVLQMPEAGIVLHSFEGNSTTMLSTSAQRNWFANFQTMTARPFEAEPGEAGFSSQWSSFMIFNFLIDANGMIHVRSGSTGIQALSDVTGRSEGGVGGLEREIEGLDQPSIAEQAFRAEEARREARQRASEQPMELGIGNARASGIVYVDSITDPSMWSHTLSRDTSEPANSFHAPLRPPNFILSGGRRFNLNPNRSVTPRTAMPASE
jgi:Domain of unknown function (DUF4157)